MYIYNANKYYRVNVRTCKITSFTCDILLLFKNNSEDGRSQLCFCYSIACYMFRLYEQPLQGI